MSRSSRVPTGRLERLVRLGTMVGGFAVGGLRESASRFLGTKADANPFLTVQNAEALARRLSKMRGAAMKLGQLVSMQGEDLVPPEFARALALLRDAADTMPEKQLRGVLVREYGKDWERRFARFDLTPIASASIGQVHAARAADGRELALKIQYPGVARSIDSDLSALHTLLRMSKVLPVDVDVRGILAEARAQLHREANYLDEADNLEAYAALVREAEPDCAVPRVHRDLSTRRILAMERVHGTRLEEVMHRRRDPELNDALGALILRLFLRELFEFRFMQTDPNIGNYLVEEESGRLFLLDLGGARRWPPELAERSRRLLAAGRDEDRDAVQRTIVELGFLDPDDPEPRRRAIVELVLLIAEPMGTPGIYDFGRGNLAARVNAARNDLVLKKGYLRAPPAETIFLLRKFTGVYFLLNRLGARLDVRATVAPFLAKRRGKVVDAAEPH